MGPVRLVWGSRRGGEGDTGLLGSLPVLPLPAFFTSAASWVPQSFLLARPLKIASVIARSKPQRNDPKLPIDIWFVTIK